MRRGPPASGVHRAGIFALFLFPGGRPRCFAPELDRAAAEEAEGSICLGVVEEEVALEEEGEVPEVSKRLYLRGAAGAVLCSEAMRHHDGLTPRGPLRRPPFFLTSCGRATRPWPLHLHMVL
jgi:hypothetical protein